MIAVTARGNGTGSLTVAAQKRHKDRSLWSRLRNDTRTVTTRWMMRRFASSEQCESPETA